MHILTKMYHFTHKINSNQAWIKVSNLLNTRSLKEKDVKNKFSSSSNFFPQTHHFMLSKTLRNLQLLVQIPPKPLFWSPAHSYLVFLNKVVDHEWFMGEAIHNLQDFLFQIIILPDQKTYMIYCYLIFHIPINFFISSDI